MRRARSDEEDEPGRGEDDGRPLAPSFGCQPHDLDQPDSAGHDGRQQQQRRKTAEPAKRGEQGRRSNPRSRKAPHHKPEVL